MRTYQCLRVTFALLGIISLSVAQTPYALTTLHTFPAAPGDGAKAQSIVAGPNGVLYGTTAQGGAGACLLNLVPGCGTVFQLTPPAQAGGTWTETILYSFKGPGGDGAIPNPGSLLIGANGELYGTTSYGGSGPCNATSSSPAGCGIVYALIPPSAPGGAWTESVLYNFTGQNGDGANPNAGVIFGRKGVLYGTTKSGGLSGGPTGANGTVFELSPPAAAGDAWSEAVLYAFTGNNDGANPDGGVAVGRAGTLYGTTSNAGANFAGTVFELTPPAKASGKWRLTTLRQFKEIGGQTPFAGLTQGTKGALYGTTYQGGAGKTPDCRYTRSFGCGTVFELTPPPKGAKAWTEKVLHSFSFVNDGANPGGPVALGANGSLYGTTQYGGKGANGLKQAGSGMVFELTPPTAPRKPWTETILYTFAKTDPEENPTTGVVLGSNGVIYGVTAGAVFQLAQ